MSEHLPPLHPPVLSVRGDGDAGASRTDDPTSPERTYTEGWIKMGLTLAIVVIGVVLLLWAAGPSTAGGTP